MNREYRELRPSLAAVGAGLLVAVTWTLWTNSGSRLSLFICAATVIVALIDVGWALVATKRVRLAVTANPAEVIVGDTVAVKLAFAGPRQFLTVALESFSSAPSGAGVDVPATAVLSGIATAREVRHDIDVEVASHGLTGIVTCARHRVVPLVRPLAVGPRPLPAGSFPELFLKWGEGNARPAAVGDLVRGVRPYMPGDPRRRVHWRATARAGDLVVKEVEDSGPPRLLLALDMGGGGAAAERAAGRAAWYALEALRRGYSVVLATSEFADRVPSGNRRLVIAPVTSHSDVIRRLAAVASPGKLELSGAQPAEGVLLVSQQGDSWR